MGKVEKFSKLWGQNVKFQASKWNKNVKGGQFWISGKLGLFYNFENLRKAPNLSATRGPLTFFLLFFFFLSFFFFLLSLLLSLRWWLIDTIEASSYYTRQQDSLKQCWHSNMWLGGGPDSATGDVQSGGSWLQQGTTFSS